MLSVLRFETFLYYACAPHVRELEQMQKCSFVLGLTVLLQQDMSGLCPILMYSRSMTLTDVCSGSLISSL
jgi:hypothetical protein